MSIGFDQFKWAAEQLGLRMDPEEPGGRSSRILLDGEVDGTRVHVEQWTDQFVHVNFSGFLDPPADLRLSIRTAGIASKLGELLGKHSIKVGDPAFDAAFDVNGDEPERIKALLTPGIRALLLVWAKADVRFYVTDEGVFLFALPGIYSTMDPEELVKDVRATASLAKALSVGLNFVPSSTILAPHVEAWRAYAETHGLAFSASPLRIWGGLDGAQLVTRATAIHDHDYGVDVRLRFERRLPWFLRVRPVRFFDFLERTGDAVHAATGDPAFDAELRLTTTNPARTKKLLDDETRATLLQLHHDHGDLVLDSDGLSIRTRSMIDPAAFSRLADRVARVAQKLVIEPFVPRTFGSY